MTRLSEELGQPSQRWWVAATSATLALFEGRFDDAEVLINRARTLGERAQNYDARNFFELQRFALRREQGRLAEILTELERTAQADPSRAILRCALAISYWTLGKYEEARDLLHQLASKNFSQLPVNNDWLQSAALLAELVAFTGDIDRAGALYQRLVPFENLNVDTEEVSTGAVSRYLGLLAATNQRHDLAARHFEDALAMNQRMGAHPWLARTQHDYARLCLVRNESGDQKRASDLQRQAQAANRQLRMHPYPPSAFMTKRTTTLQANSEVTRS
jgi:tetratricopeptide (TPR) repeat protein